MAENVLFLYLLEFSGTHNLLSLYSFVVRHHYLLYQVLFHCHLLCHFFFFLPSSLLFVMSITQPVALCFQNSVLNFNLNLNRWHQKCMQGDFGAGLESFKLGQRGPWCTAIRYFLAAFFFPLIWTNRTWWHSTVFLWRQSSHYTINGAGNMQGCSFLFRSRRNTRVRAICRSSYTRENTALHGFKNKWTRDGHLQINKACQHSMQTLELDYLSKLWTTRRAKPISSPRWSR